MSIETIEKAAAHVLEGIEENDQINNGGKRSLWYDAHTATKLYLTVGVEEIMRESWDEISKIVEKEMIKRGNLKTENQ